MCVTRFKVHPLPRGAKTTHLALACSFPCCLFRLVVVTDCFIVPSTFSHLSTERMMSLFSFIQFTLVGRQCSSAVPKKIHTSSIPELSNWYHRHRCCPSSCPKPFRQHGNNLYPKMDDVGPLSTLRILLLPWQRRAMETWERKAPNYLWPCVIFPF